MTAPARDGAPVTVTGGVTDVDRRRNRAGTLWAGFTLSAGETVVQVEVFPTVYARAERLLADGTQLTVTGRWDVRADRDPYIIATAIEDDRRQDDRRQDDRRRPASRGGGAGWSA